MKTLNKISILVVEDDLNLRNQLKECLEAVEYKVYVTRSSVEGLEIFKKYDIDLCIYGVELNETDGFALAAQIRILNPDMPFILLQTKACMSIC